MTMNIGRGREGHSCVNGSDNVWVLWEAVSFLGMRVQKAHPTWLHRRQITKPSVDRKLL